MAFHVGVRMASNIFFLFPLFPCYVLWAHHLYWNMPTFAISLVILSHSLSARFDLMPGRAGDGRLDGFCWYEHIVIRVPLLTHTHTHTRAHTYALSLFGSLPQHMSWKKQRSETPHKLKPEKCRSFGLASDMGRIREVALVHYRRLID